MKSTKQTGHLFHPPEIKLTKRIYDCLYLTCWTKTIFIPVLNTFLWVDPQNKVDFMAVFVKVDESVSVHAKK